MQFDLVIIGAGPAGLAAGFTAYQQGMRYVILERGVIAQTVSNYPIGKSLFSTPNEVELAPGTLKPKAGKPTREEVLIYYNQFAFREHKLNIRTHESVTTVQPVSGGFEVVSDKGTYLTQRVLFATGGFGVPRKLGVKGETPDRVSYRFSEAYPFAGQSVVVVGGGNSAAEVTLFLHEGSANVTWSLRRPTLGARENEPERVGIKPWVREPLSQFEAKGEITIVYSSKVLEVTPTAVILAVEGQSEPRAVECQHIFAMLGADPDVSLLAASGIEIAPDGRPVYDPVTFETNVKGLFVAGHLTRELHMKNAVAVPPKIVEQMAASR
ncbi:MAG: NAD(P)-binding domain-containing protein [Blastocatellia bacterium]|nr:NAD(P)-binding domain-containing protein [Blastocatellia bacterium]